MKCEAAKLTRFGALKHKSGITGYPAMILRIIACFQPLQNFQAEYFRQLLKPVTFAQSAAPHTAAVSHMRSDIRPLCIGPALSSQIASIPSDKSIVDLDTGNSEKTHQLLLQLSSMKAVDELESRSNIIYHTSKPSNTPRAQVEVQLSETCEKRFVMFDQSGSMRRIFLHPALVNKLPESAPVGADRMMDFFNTSLKAVTKLKERMDSPSPFEFALCNAGLIKTLPIGDPEVALTMKTIDDMHKSDYQHEETEDIDALLSSDNDDEADEVNSTGHSPGDLIWNDSPLQSGEEGIFSKDDCKKRKWVDDANVYEEEDVGSSAPTVMGSKPAKMFCSTLQPEFIKQSLLHDSGYSGYDKELHSYHLSWPDELSSSNSGDNKQRPCRNAPKQARKEQIKSAFRLLRGMLPSGGEGMGTTNVLDEAIEFVKDLEMKVQNLKAKSFV